MDDLSPCSRESFTALSGIKLMCFYDAQYRNLLGSIKLMGHGGNSRAFITSKWTKVIYNLAHARPFCLMMAPRGFLMLKYNGTPW